MRLFVAIKIPDNVSQMLTRYQPEPEQDIRIVDKSLFHITLNFIGDRDASIFCQILTGIKASSFTINIKGFGRFEGRNNSSVLWAGISPSEALNNLHETIASQLLQLDIRKERTGYTPHITLARCNHRYSETKIQNFINNDSHKINIPVNQFGLYRSELTSEGPHYTLIQNYPLR